MNKRTGAAVAAFGLTVTLTGVVLPAATAHDTGIHDNCTNFNNKYPHGVGRRGAVDRGGTSRTSSGATGSTAGQTTTTATLDRDNDKIACEKA